MVSASFAACSMTCSQLSRMITHAPAGEEFDDARCRISGLHHEIERRSYRARNKVGILQGPEIDETHRLPAAGRHLMGNGQRHRRFADASRTPEGNELLREQPVRQAFDHVVPPDHPGQEKRKRGRFRELGRRRRRRGRLRLATLHAGDKTVSPIGDVGDEACAVFAVAEYLAKLGDVDAEAGLVHDQIWPRIGQQLILVNDLSGATHQQTKNVDRAAAYLYRNARLSRAVAISRRDKTGQTLRRRNQVRSREIAERPVLVREAGWHGRLLLTNAGTQPSARAWLLCRRSRAFANFSR